MPLYMHSPQFTKPVPPWRQTEADRRRSQAAIDALTQHHDHLRAERERRAVALPMVAPRPPWTRCEIDDLPRPAKSFAVLAERQGHEVALLRAGTCFEVRVDHGRIRAWWGGVSERGTRLAAGGVIRGRWGWQGVTALRAALTEERINP